MQSVVDNQSTPPGGVWRVRNPDDGVIIATGLPSHTWRAWAAHRRAKEQSILSQMEMEDIFCRQLPAGCSTCGAPPVNPHLYPELEPILHMDREDKSIWGVAMWKILHSHQITGDESENWAWLRAFSVSIPCKISCKPHFDTFIAEHPPVFESQEGFLRWSYDCHQSVNARLGKPGISWDECRSIYLSA